MTLYQAEVGKGASAFVAVSGLARVGLAALAV